MGVRVEERGKSECRAVMARIGVEQQQHHLTRKRADFHMVFHHEIPRRTSKEAEQMTVEVKTGAASRNFDWHAVDRRKSEEVVRRLQARIVKATQEGRHGRVKAL